jgi:hypothetical protein
MVNSKQCRNNSGLLADRRSSFHCVPCLLQDGLSCSSFRDITNKTMKVPTVIVTCGLTGGGRMTPSSLRFASDLGL